MVFSRNRFILLLPLLLLGFFNPLTAQVCTPESLVPPPMDAGAMPKTPTEDFKNRFKFELAWDRTLIETCRHNNPPNPWAPGQDSLARWVYFWNFGDGTFSRDSAPEHTFPAGTYVVQAAIKPIYSDDGDPLGYMTSTVVVDSQEVPAIYPSRIHPDSSIALTVNWAASRPAGRLVFALTYKKILEQGDPARTVYFMFPRDEFDFEGMQSGPAPSFSFSEEYDGKTHRIYAWKFEQVENNGIPSDENSLFIELKVKDAVANLLPDTESEMVTSVKAMYKREVTQKTGQGNLFGFETLDQFGSKGGTGGGVSNTFFEDGLDEMTHQPISLNWASDPNAMSVYPEILEPGAENAQLHYRVDFFNSGTATANELRVDATIDNNKLNTGTLQTISTQPTALTDLPPVFLSENSIRWTTDTAGLLSLGQAQSASFPDELSFGYVNFNMKTKAGLPMQEGDTIRAQARIQMDDSEVTTNEALVRVQHLRVGYPCVWGLKGYYNFRFDKNAIHRSGFSFALTLRKALCKIPNPQNRYFFAGRIPKSVLPMFWWQAELGYGQSKLEFPEIDSLRLGHLDLTPAMLRFIAKKPSLKFGNNAVVPRGWGLSAAYTASFLLHGKSNNNNSLNLGDLSFGDRLDHSISVSLDLLNLVGQPGLSFGFGWRWRNSAITGQRDWYDHPFVYAHYTFSHRLRYELGGFK